MENLTLDEKKDKVVDEKKIYTADDLNVRFVPE